jgi:HK97 family phage major capsid protein
MSTSIQALRERVAALNREANAILAEKGSQVWSKEDQAKFDGLMDEAERGMQQVARMQRMAEQDADKNFTDATRNQRDTKLNPILQGLEVFLRTKPQDRTPDQQALVRNTMSTTTGSEGGFTVQTLVAKNFVDLLKAYGYMRKVASQITTDSGADMGWPTTDGTAEVGERVAQNASATGADIVFASRALNTYKYSSKIIAIPVELVQDTSIDLPGLVLRRMRDRIGRVLNVDYTIGTGSSQPFGLAPTATVGKVGTTGQTLTIIYDDLVDMVDSLDAAYLDVPITDPQMPNAEPGWMFSQTMRRVVRKIKDTAGRPIWTPSYDEGLASATPDRLLGYPVYINNDMPVPAANAKSLAFGNLSLYQIRDAMQVLMQRFDDSVYASKGQVGYLAWARSGGNLMDINGVRTYQHSAT